MVFRQCFVEVKDFSEYRFALSEFVLQTDGQVELFICRAIYLSTFSGLLVINCDYYPIQLANTARLSLIPMRLQEIFRRK